MILWEDTPKKRKGKRCKHIMTDNCIDELHAFAKMVGLKEEWFQISNNGIPHYEVFSEKIDNRILEIMGQIFVCDCGKHHWIITKMTIQSMVKKSIRMEIS